MSGGSLRDLLFPDKNGGDREERLARLRRELDDPEVRQALADYLAERERRQRQAEEDPEQGWEKGRHGESKEEDANELLELSAALAASLGAKQPRAIPMPVSIWIPAAAGLILGALGVWFALIMFPHLINVVGTRPVKYATFEAAMDELIAQAQADPQTAAQLGKLLQHQQESVQTGVIGPSPELTRRFYEVIAQYEPSSNQIKQALARLETAQPPGASGRMVPGQRDQSSQVPAASGD